MGLNALEKVMTESFAQMFEVCLGGHRMCPVEMLTGCVSEVARDVVVVSA